MFINSVNKFRCFSMLVLLVYSVVITNVILVLSSAQMGLSLFWGRLGTRMDECNSGKDGEWVVWQWPNFCNYM